MKPENTIDKERLSTNKEWFDADLSIETVGVKTQNAERKVLSKFSFKNENEIMSFSDKRNLSPKLLSLT